MGDSDSAPEDVSFQTAKDQALDNLRGAAQAVRDLKEKKKEARKRKSDFLKDQKAKKLARLKELEGKKLPDALLASIAETTPEEKTAVETEVAEPENKIKTFASDDEEENGSGSGGDDSVVVDVGSTQFNIVTPRDLAKAKFKSSTAWGFKQQMLYGSRVPRQDQAKKNAQMLKKQALKTLSIVKS